MVCPVVVDPAAQSVAEKGEVNPKRGREASLADHSTVPGFWQLNLVELH